MDRSLQHAFDAEEVMAYLDGELEPRRAALLASHLEHCGECQSVATELRLVSGRMMDFEIEPMAAGVTSAMLVDLNASATQEPRKAVGYEPKILAKWRELAAKRSVWAIAGAVAVVVTLAVGLGIPAMHRSEMGPSVAIRSENELAAPASRGYKAWMQKDVAG